MSSLRSRIEQRFYVGAKGIKLAGDVGGNPSSPTVLLLHGAGQTRHSWGSAMRQLLERGYHVVNMDSRGHGDSEWATDGDYTFATLAEDVACVIATLSSQPALVGASMGGATALWLAGTVPKPLLSALVLVDVVPQMDPVGAAKILTFMKANPDGFATLDAAADAVAAYNTHRPRPTNPAGLMRNLRRRENGRLYWHWDPKFVVRPKGVEPSTRLRELAAAAERVEVPTLLVRGEKSDIVSDAGVADLLRRIPGAEVVDVAGAGHMIAGDRNDAFNEGVFEFLARRLPVDRADAP